MPDQDVLSKLQAENARLIALLESHRIEWRQPPASSPAALELSRLSTGEKVVLFRRLFRGRTDVYPTRWKSKTTGKSGYAPACANEWRPGVCEKPRIKCSDCSNRSFIPLSDAVIYGHLAGEHTIGVYLLGFPFREILKREQGVSRRARASSPRCAQVVPFDALEKVS